MKNAQVVEQNSNYQVNNNNNSSIRATSLDLKSLVNKEDNFFIELYNSHLPKKYVDFLVKSRDRAKEVRRSGKEPFVPRITTSTSSNNTLY
jgi:hypothetical protein